MMAMGDLQSVVQSVVQVWIPVGATKISLEALLVEVQALEQEKVLMQALYYGQLHHPGLENDLR